MANSASKPVATATIEKPKTKKKGALSHVSIDCTDNGGYVVNVSRKSEKKDKENMSCGQWDSGEKLAVSSKAELDTLLDSIFGEAHGKESATSDKK